MSNLSVRKNNTARDEYVLLPLTDIYETEGQYTLKMEMPGITKDKLEVLLEDNELEIRGEADRYSPEGKELKYSEFSQYNYYRKYNVGDDIDREGIDAKFENGVLTLVLKKHEAAKPRRIPINVK